MENRLVADAFIVDTNVIVRFLLKDDAALSPKAKLFWDEVIAGSQSAFVPQAIIAECVFVMARVARIPRAEISSNLLQLILTRGVSTESREVVVRALRLFASHAIGFADALVIAHAEDRKAAIMSFDKDLLKTAGKLRH